jgi:hypothetical protein
MVLIGGVLGFQLLNVLKPEKSLLATYMGKFVIDLNATGGITTQQDGQVSVFFDKISGFPDLALNTSWHVVFIFLFVLFVSAVTLIYNYQIYKLFEKLSASIKSGTPFNESVSLILTKLASFSVLVFGVGSLLSLAKLSLIQSVWFESFVVKPVFDNQFFNFLWLGIGIYILNEIYKVGLEIKKEQDLTI